MRSEAVSPVAWLAALLLACAALLAAPVQAGDPAILGQQGGKLHFRDDVGRELALPAPLTRVVVFNRYTTEFVRAVGGMPAVVGVDIDSARGKEYWPTVTPDMLAGQGQSSPNYEAIVALRPQAVFFPRNSDWQKAAEVLGRFHIAVVVVTAWDVLKHEQNVSLLGRLFGQPQRAEKLNAFYRGYRELLAQRLKGVARKRVYIEEVGNYKTLLKGSGWHDMVELGGGQNVFGDVEIAGQSSARGTVQGFSVDPEEVIARRPEVIVKLEPAQYLPHPRAFSAQVLQGIAARPGFAGLPAVRSGQVYHISYYLAGACSKIIGALQIAKWLYPERFTDVDPEQAMKAWLEQFQDVPAPGGYSVSLAELRK
ncbi:ABC transporter substrate-binding protein [Herbaspirillum sp. WKF16]|jgi:iron complex transport system substrate-binding protein|uniref:ABC transporter substrate-binding protein n=1 Tax=Herbaspirillum sp. WKF16 TaxID=3028312 RepID=UPI0023A9896D|nr:ABC transporter substrate-binding protein [Herbaspirillum sp. WKF16]WDZ96660.1 ABC transporter substrate-binding protein [Herbaspirillum sp. WKF16]